MGIVTAYVLAAVVIAALLVIACLAYALRAATVSERASMASERIAGQEQLRAERNQLEAERQRDEAVVKAATARAAADKALGQLAMTQDRLNAALARLTEHIERQVLGASPTQVAGIVSDLLATAILPGPGGK